LLRLSQNAFFTATINSLC